jgi:ribose transport system substrate-binding protein
MQIAKIVLGAAAMAFVSFGAVPAAAQNAFEGLDMAPDKIGGIEDMEDIAKYCGTKPIKVGFSDGWGGNYWRQITRREFEDEAKKCPNITEIRYTDGEFKPEKQIADIQSLIAQKFDVIIVFADTGGRRPKPALPWCPSLPGTLPSATWARTISSV